MIRCYDISHQMESFVKVLDNFIPSDNNNRKGMPPDNACHSVTNRIYIKEYPIFGDCICSR